MMPVFKWIAGCLGIGRLKGGGTLAAMVAAASWYLLWQAGYGNRMMGMITLVLICLGIWVGSQVEKDWGKDSSKVVIDEAAGMCVGLLFVPVSLTSILTGLLLFRVFDITKPFYIRKMESLPGGWGVMMDDVLAGIYTNIILQVVIHYQIM